MASSVFPVVEDYTKEFGPDPMLRGYVRQNVGECEQDEKQQIRHYLDAALFDDKLSRNSSKVPVAR